MRRRGGPGRRRKHPGGGRCAPSGIASRLLADLADHGWSRGLCRCARAVAAPPSCRRGCGCSRRRRGPVDRTERLGAADPRRLHAGCGCHDRAALVRRRRRGVVRRAPQRSRPGTTRGVRGPRVRVSLGRPRRTGVLPGHPAGVSPQRGAVVGSVSLAGAGRHGAGVHGHRARERTAMTTPVAADVTVLVPTTGGPLLQGCLDSIAASTVWPGTLVVVDQGRSPAAAVAVRGLRDLGIDANHHPSERTGISAAMNDGLRQVRTPYVAVTHDDCRVDRSWLEAMTLRLRALGDEVLTGRVEPVGDGIVLTVITSDEPAVHRRPSPTSDVLFPPNMGFAVRILERVGPFDEHPALRTAGEDNEWAYRCLRAGVPIVYDPTVVVGHLARFSAEDLPRLYRRYARGQGAFYGRHLRNADAFILRRAARDLLRAPWLLLRGLAQRNPELVAMGWGEMAGLLPGILAGLRRPPQPAMRGS
ncbi:MAG: glycosyltransferase [Nitriliruptorales bacterium]|nr:glycosyltransferase [Nitriliruptorales bacterium]